VGVPATCCRRAVGGTLYRRTCPPKSAVYDHLDLWDWDGTLERVHHPPYVTAREQAGREASLKVAYVAARNFGFYSGSQQAIRLSSARGDTRRLKFFVATAVS
jgi:hypothetical protein